MVNGSSIFTVQTTVNGYILQLTPVPLVYLVNVIIGLDPGLVRSNYIHC